jgi:cold shock protein
MESNSRMLSSAAVTEPAVYVGRVKWFNTKAGYGFITSLADDSDIFAHHSAVQVSTEQYRFLVQGEYVEFDLNISTDPAAVHKQQAVNIRGIQSGKLMCETIFENKQQQQQKYQQEPQTPAPPPLQPQPSNTWARKVDPSAGDFQVQGRQRPQGGRGQGQGRGQGRGQGQRAAK